VVRLNFKWRYEVGRVHERARFRGDDVVGGSAFFPSSPLPEPDIQPEEDKDESKYATERAAYDGGEV